MSHPRISSILFILASTLATGCGPNDASPPLAPSAMAAEPTGAAVEPSVTVSAASESVLASTPAFDPADFVATVDNPLSPLVPGTRFVYRGSEEGEPLRDIVDVTHDHRTLAGVRAIVVLDRLFRSGELVERTFDYFAQDKLGNVWYLGEDTKEFEDGKLVSTEGTWHAGVAGARAGIFMPAHPEAGETVQQEFAAGVAEDKSTFAEIGTSVTVPFGTLDHCVRTRDFTPLEPGAVETKWYCRGVGLVKSRDVKGGDVRLELVRVERP